MTLAELLVQLSINIGSNVIYDQVKNYFQKNSTPTQSELEIQLASFLRIQNADIYARKIVEFLAKNGDIKIDGSKIYAGESICMFSNQKTKLTFGNNSESITENTKIVNGSGAYIQAQGGAGIRQNEDGSISFFT